MAELALEKVILYCDELSRSPTLIPYSDLMKKVSDVLAENDLEFDFATKHNFRQQIENFLPELKFVNTEHSLYVSAASLSLQSAL